MAVKSVVFATRKNTTLIKTKPASNVTVKMMHSKRMKWDLIPVNADALALFCDFLHLISYCCRFFAVCFV